MTSKLKRTTIAIERHNILTVRRTRIDTDVAEIQPDERFEPTKNTTDELVGDIESCTNKAVGIQDET